MSKKFKLEMQVAADVSEVKKATQEILAFKNKFDTITTQVRNGLFLGIGAGLGNQIASVFSQALPSYLNQEKAEASLMQAMKNRMLYTKEALADFKNMAAEIQNLTTITDETVLSMQSMALNMGVSRARMQECVQGAIGLQKAYGMGLNEALKASAAIIQGKTEKLNELIPALKNCETNEQKLAMAQSAMRNGFAQAKAETATLAGTLTQLSNAWKEVAETVGENVAPVIKEAADIITGLANILNRNKWFVSGLTKAFIALTAAMAVTKVLNYAKAFSVLTTATKANTAAVVANTIAQNANLKSVGSLGKLGKNISSMGGGLLKTGGALATIGENLLRIGGAFSKLAPVAAALFGIAEGSMAVKKEFYDLPKEAAASCAKTTKSILDFAQPMVENLKNVGGSADDVAKAFARLDVAERNMEFIKKSAKNEGFDTTEVDKNIDALRKQRAELNANKKAIIEIYNEKQKAFTDQGNKTFYAAKDKLQQSNSNVSEAQQLEKLNIAIDLKKRTIYDFELRIKDAQGEQKTILADQYSGEVNKLIELKKQQAALQAHEAAINAQVVAYNEEWRIESNILKAQISGNKEAIEKAKNEQKILQYKKAYVAAHKEQYKISGNLDNLDKDALTHAQKKLALEQKALQTEQQREQSKKRQQSIEDYTYRIKIAQAKLRGDEEGVKKLEEAQASKQEIENLVASTGMSREEAEKMVLTTRATEAQAAAAESQRANSAGLPMQGMGGGYSAPEGNPRGPTPPRRPATVSAKNQEAYDQWKEQRKNGGIGKDVSFADYRQQIQPKAPSGGGLPNNPSKEAGGKAENKTQKEIADTLKDTKKIWDKMEKLLKNIDNNTSATAQNNKE